MLYWNGIDHSMKMRETSRVLDKKLGDNNYQNVGTEGGDPPAHYRYTEYRLAKISEDGILDGVKRNAVEFEPNFDETRQEPKTLPAIFPNLLCNPNGGIGVTLACTWAPHNLREVAAAIFDYLDGKEPTLPGPDFPTGGVVINKDDIPKIMATGKGTVRLRSKYEISNNSIIFYELPYGVNTEDVIKQLQDLAVSEKVEGVTAVRDESDKTTVKVVVDCKKGANLNKIITTAFQETDIQSTFSYNQIALVDKEPKLLNLKDCIEIYVNHNVDCIIRESKFTLDKKNSRKEVVDGLLKALEDIDNIVSLIKNSNSPTQAKVDLIERYGFSDNQAQAILDMELSKLAGLEKIKLEKEHASLINEIVKLMNIISSKEAQIEILRSKLKSIVDRYGDDRRTELTQITLPKKDKEPVVVEPKDCVVVVSKNGLAKRVDCKNFKPQKRATAGVKTNSDLVSFSQKTNTQDYLMVFTTKGKVYRMLVDSIPEGTNTSTGMSLAVTMKFESDEQSIAYTTLNRDTTKQYVFFATKNGIVKKVPIKEYEDLKRTGVLAIKFKDGDELATVTLINQEQIMLLTKNGMAIRFETAEMPISSRIAQGVKGIKLNEGDYVVAAIPISNSDQFLATVSLDGLGKKTELKEYPIQGRGGKGVACYKGTIAGGMILSEDELVLISGNKTSIVINSKEIPTTGRVASGNILLKNNDFVTSIAKV